MELELISLYDSFNFEDFNSMKIETKKKILIKLEELVASYRCILDIYFNNEPYNTNNFLYTAQMMHKIISDHLFGCSFPSDQIYGRRAEKTITNNKIENTDENFDPTNGRLEKICKILYETYVIGKKM